ncbi:aminotransferase class I/II-fold pyridoxal phosphate-dependent enzyme [Desulfolutivibrio sulfoxidireducens]|nr:aminotransferase class I/II-fold pyridoxal phosphate-dependent enzyme [Desulfolutivibrio sulfoxidireducens]QLA21714.1 aminotransferase class I/II-fold pyridoxal phosphate-dependent enzyme [Desulfolutivibrio sulfoxidireducens]
MGIAEHDKHSLIQKMREKLSHRQSPSPRASSFPAATPAEDVCDFRQFADVKKIQIHKAVARQWNIDSLYFLCHDGVAKDTTSFDGRVCLNFSTYDYLGLNGSPELNAAAMHALDHYGSSSSGSRPTSGERPPHRELERALADLHGAKDCVVFVSGHATNVWTIYQLFKKRDLVLYDSLSHNSIIQGAQISGAVRMPFPHNDLDALEAILAAERQHYRRTLLVTEGLFSMDGDIPDLPRLIELKKKYRCFLMVDEAHALGVLGGTGRGIAEHFGVDPGGVDIWMGTLSKTLCGCGGYVAGCAELVECLKYLAPGFLYSVGMSPPLAAVSREAIAMMLREPRRVRALQEISAYFLEYARGKGLNTGRAQGHAIFPIMVGGSIEAALLASRLFQKGVYVIPIIFPVVEERAARLRFFLSSSHTREQVRRALDLVARELPLVHEEASAMIETQHHDASLDDLE